ncbi:villin-5-like isoform X2 [Rutidosis leptorrhynchoides]|uniref:villin-5-like isoform X2 n=1 Tax=Rutidosis leptorrhynchoides TaxID=125765 RepID=UPI003A9A4200
METRGLITNVYLYSFIDYVVERKGRILSLLLDRKKQHRGGSKYIDVQLTEGKTCQGGITSNYKSYIAEQGLTDETYSSDGVAVIRILGSAVHNNKAAQLDHIEQLGRMLDEDPSLIEKKRNICQETLVQQVSKRRD